MGCRRGSDPALLWLWRRPVATAPIQPLAWEPPYATGEGEGVGWTGCKLFHMEWISNEVLLHSTGNYIQSPGINHNMERNIKKNLHMGVPVVAQWLKNLTRNHEVAGLAQWVKDLALP